MKRTKILTILFVGVISVLPPVAVGQPGQNGQPNGQPFEQIWNAIEEIWNTLDGFQEQIVQEISDRIDAVQNLQNQIDTIELQEGPPGPQGEPGPAGPQGPQGESGTVGGIYEILGLTSIGPSGQTLQPGDARQRYIYNLGYVEGYTSSRTYCGVFTAIDGVGVYGHGGTIGVKGQSDATGGIGGSFWSNDTGVRGYGKKVGVEGESDETNGIGGVFKNNSSGSIGVYGNGGKFGVQGNGGEFGVYGVGSVAAVLGSSNTMTGIGGQFLSNGTGVRASGRVCDFLASGHGIDYHSDSSIRWKRDIQVIHEPLEKILRLRGVYFNWDADHGGGRDVGMIAEEVGKVLPEIVCYEEDGTYTSGMDYSRLTPLLVEAVKVLRSENQELKQRIEALERAIPENRSGQTEELKHPDGLRDTVKENLHPE